MKSKTKYKFLRNIIKEEINNLTKEKQNLDEGWKEIALGAALLLGASFNNKAMSQKAQNAIGDTEILNQIKSTLENEEGRKKLSTFLNMNPSDLNSYMINNANKVENNFNKVANKKNMNLTLDVRDTKTKSGVQSRLERGYAVSDVIIHKDTILETGSVVVTQDTIILNYSNDNMFITGSYDLNKDIIKDINQVLNDIKTLGASIINIEVESSTDKEPINITNPVLAKNRANSVIEVLKSMGVNSNINTKILADQGPDLYSKTMSKEQRDIARRETSRYRYAKISFIIQISEPVINPEPLYKIEERIEVKMVKTGLNKKPGMKSSSGLGGKKRGGSKCKKIISPDKQTKTDCSFTN